MKTKKRITITADILVDEDFDTNYLCIAEQQGLYGIDDEIYVGKSDNFEILEYISQETVDLDENEG